MARILVIEIKSSIRMIIQKIFEGAGHTVFAVGSCDEAAKISSMMGADVVVFNASVESAPDRAAFSILRSNYRDKYFIVLMEEELCFSMDVEIVNGFDRKYFRPLSWEKIIEDISRIEVSPTNSIRRNIMVVDDNRSIHDDFKKILCHELDFNKKVDALSSELFGQAVLPVPSGRAYDYHIISAFSGEEAIGLVKNHVEFSCPIDVIFMDIRMGPGVDGVDACCRIRDLYPEAAFIFCSAYSDYSTQDILKKIGSKNPVYFLKKPFEIDDVHKILSQILDEDVQIA